MPALQIFIDTHVHFYPCYDDTAFLQAAFRNASQLAQANGSTQATPRILCFTEAAGYHYFQQWRECLAAGEVIGGYSGTLLEDEGVTILVLNDNASDEVLWLLPGRQINASNGLEVSAFGLQEALPDGGSLQDIVAQVLAAGAIPVLPWGVGKWFGGRGKEVQQVLECYSGKVGVSDNANRPLFWPMPRLLKPDAISSTLLAGSDPLPLADTQQDVGRYGTIVTSEKPLESGRQVLSLLQPGSMLVRKVVGRRETGVNFFVNQIKMQIRKRAAK